MHTNIRHWITLVEAITNDPARLERAQQMGYDTAHVWYHGSTGKDIEAFDPARLGHNTGAKSATKGFFFTSDPKVAVSYGRHEHYMPDESRPAYVKFAEQITELEAEMQSVLSLSWSDARTTEEESLRQQFYQGPKRKRISADAYWAARDAIEKKYDTDESRAAATRYQELVKQVSMLKTRRKGMETMSAINRAVVFPVYLKILKPLIYDMGGNHYRETSYNDLLVSARRGRRDGAIIRNTFDPGYRGADAPMCDIAIVFSPRQVRSVHANFDPNKADSPNISD
jgi:hypothetical protein